jgi:putative membrane protein
VPILIKFPLKIAVNSAAIYTASSIVEGFTFSGNLFILAGIGLALVIFQTLIYPIIKIVAFPLVFLSFGLFGSIINLIVLWGVSLYVPELSIEGIVPLVLGAAILSITHIVFSWL